MVCAKCEKKLAKSSTLATTDVWRSADKTSGGDRNARKVGENKLLSAKARFSPYAPAPAAATSSKYAARQAALAGASSSSGAGTGGSTFGKCETCKQTVQRAGAKYCQGCAYKKGVCAMCAKQILDTSQYKMSSK